MKKPNTTTKKLLWLLESERLRSHDGFGACDMGVISLKDRGWAYCYKHNCESNVDWLGLALIARGAINPPIIPKSERFIFTHRPSDNTYVPADGLSRWYYPRDVLADGVERVFEEEWAKYKRGN